MEVKFAICDDVKEVCTNLEDMLIEEFEVTGKKCVIDIFYTGEAFCKEFEPQKYEVVFLDIELTGMDGLEVSRYIREEEGDEYTQIVYISGKTEYMMQFFEYHPLYFLKKPFKKEQVEWLMEKYQKIVRQDDAYFYYKVKKEQRKIPLANILYFESQKRKIIIHTKQKLILFYGKLDEIEQIVSKYKFIRISKAFLVNYHYVQAFSNEYVTLSGNEPLKISRNYRKNVQEKQMQYMVGEKTWKA